MRRGGVSAEVVFPSRWRHLGKRRLEVVRNTPLERFKWCPKHHLDEYRLQVGPTKHHFEQYRPQVAPPRQETPPGGAKTCGKTLQVVF